MASVLNESVVEEQSASEVDRAPHDTGHARADTLAASVMLLMGLSCIQPLVAFVRGVIFCRWLEPDQLGMWDMAFSFVTLAAPVVVFGIPGSFGRYVQHYLKRQQIGAFLRRTTAACLLFALVAVSLLMMFREAIAETVFGDASYRGLVPLVAACLVATIGFGFVTELLTSLRLFRIASLAQVLKGSGFALFGGLLLWQWRAEPASVMAAYAAACGLVTLLAAWRIVQAVRAMPRDGAVPPHRQLWAKLMPFAGWIWFINAIENLYMIADRYMLLHASGMSNDNALAAVGHYHSSLIVPMLFASFAGMLATMILPHLSHDWEAGRRRRVDQHVSLAVKLLAVALAGGSFVVLLAGPLLFEIGFQGKYDGGLAVLPWTLTLCALAGLTFVAETYIWCTERVRLGAAALFVGLATNIGLNFLLLPTYGLLGAVMATTVSRVLVLGLIGTASVYLGMKFRPAVWLLALLPGCVLLGPVAGGIILVAVLAVALFTQQLFSRREKAVLLRTLRDARRKIGH